MNKTISLRKARKILKHACACYDKMSDQLTSSDFERFSDDLQALDDAVKEKNHEVINELTPKIKEFCKVKFKKSPARILSELLLGLVILVAIGIPIRQMWFELYQIPSGSMRPTYQEEDRLTVSKTQFGLNIPLMAEHFYFNPDLVERTGTVIFMGDNLPLPDASSWYWSRRYIKRVIGKPGDTLYFYGGKIYGIDKDGKPLTELIENPQMQVLEHIPYLSFLGKPEQNQPNQVIIRQMHQPIGRIAFTPWGSKGEVWNGKDWVPDQPEAARTDHHNIQTYSDLWGIGNFAMTRILSPDEVKADPTLKQYKLPEAPLYLELNHTPSFSRINSPLRSIIPLQQRHLDALMDHMNTTRFDVKDGFATVYGHTAGGSMPLLGVPDGRYQFDRGKAESVGIQGTTHPLPADHPLYKRTAERIKQLYNNGIDWTPRDNGLPNRYAYFRDGDLYLLNTPIFNKDDPVLVQFVVSEEQRELNSKSYTAFKDHGVPSESVIKAFGVKVPEGHYLVLGDNHAISGDSRIMGFIPEGNLRGVPDLLLTPIGDRWPSPELAPPYKTITLPRVIVWVVAGTAGAVLLFYTIKRRKKGYFKRKNR